MEKYKKIAALFVATLRASYLIHTQNHWLVKGSEFYSNHLLFQRLYELSEESTDKAAEKFIGLFGSECLDYKVQKLMINTILSKFEKYSKNPIIMSLKIEESFVALCKDTYDILEKEDKLSLGLDDLVMSISSDHETAIYLLKQSLKQS
jgi:DNA-binding ferritin-like protein